MGRGTSGWIASGLVAVVGCTTTIDNTGGGGTSGTSGSSSGTSGQSSGSYEDDIPPGATRPPPIITNVSPTSGDYGTLVTITGDNLDEGSAKLVLGGSIEDVTYDKPAAGSTGSGKVDAIIKKWSKTEIQFRYPFPADGAVRIKTKAGEAEGSTFTPSYRPGTPVSGRFGRGQLLGIVSPSAGTVVAVFDGTTGPQILVAGADGNVKSTPFDRGSKELQTASIYVSGDNVEGLFVSDGKLFQLTDAMGTAKTTSTGVAATMAAGGRDATGTYAWVKSGAQIRKLRAPSWAATAETVTDPTPASAPGPSLAVASDRSLYVGWGVNDDGSFPFYDHTTGPVVRRLRPGQTTFDAAKSVGGGADDYMLWTRFLPGPDGRITSFYCANDTGVFASSEIDLDCEEGHTGDVTIPSRSISSEYVIGHGATPVIASCDVATATLKVGPEKQTAQQVSMLFPCPAVVSLAPDAKGAAQVLVQSGNYVYAPKKR